MMIGRVDELLTAPASEGLIFDLTLRACERRWPNGVFLDADEEALLPLSGPAVWLRQPSGEFFVFSDRRTAERWDDLGPCEENWNQMLHFLLRPRQDQFGAYLSVTVVVDERTGEMVQFLRDLQETFFDSQPFSARARGAA